MIIHNNYRDVIFKMGKYVSEYQSIEILIYINMINNMDYELLLSHML